MANKPQITKSATVNTIAKLAGIGSGVKPGKPSVKVGTNRVKLK